MIGDWVTENFGWVLLAAFAALGVGVAFSVSAENDKRALFMAECQQDGHKRYQCEVMYDGAQPDTVVTPAPIIIGR